MEVQGAEPSRGFVFSGPRGRGLSRAWLGGKERVGGGARTLEMLTLHCPPRGWWSREECERLRDALMGRMGDPGHHPGSGVGVPEALLGNTGQGRELGGI